MKDITFKERTQRVRHFHTAMNIVGLKGIDYPMAELITMLYDKINESNAECTIADIAKVGVQWEEKWTKWEQGTEEQKPDYVSVSIYDVQIGDVIIFNENVKSKYLTPGKEYEVMQAIRDHNYNRIAIINNKLVRWYLMLKHGKILKQIKEIRRKVQ